MAAGWLVYSRLRRRHGQQPPLLQLVFAVMRSNGARAYLASRARACRPNPGEDRRVFHQPYFIGHGFVARLCEQAARSSDLRCAVRLSQAPSTAFRSVGAARRETPRCPSVASAIQRSVLDQLNAAILGAALFTVVGRNRTGERDAHRQESLLVDHIASHEKGCHRRRTSLGKLHICRETTDIVGMSHNKQPQHRIVLEQLCHLLQGGVRLRLDVGLVGVELDSVQSHLA